MSNRCTHDPVQVVSREPIFSSLSDAECGSLVERSLCRATRRGETLFREGDTCRGLYLVLEGVVRVYRSNPLGQEQVFGLYGKGDSLGEVALFDGGPYLVSARVTTAGRILFLDLDQVQALYHSHPEVARAVVRQLSSRVRSMAALVDRLSLQDVPTRVAGAILHYAREARALQPGASFRLPRTQEELAAELGTTREGVARALARLRSAGVIGQSRSMICLVDPQELEHLGSELRASSATSRC
jgi:CRP-like cAMP-binding protein